MKRIRIEYADYAKTPNYATLAFEFLPRLKSPKLGQTSVMALRVVQNTIISVYFNLHSNRIPGAASRLVVVE